jgi:hypothetical protein
MEQFKRRGLDFSIQSRRDRVSWVDAAAVSGVVGIFV